ncbi:MAG TPA: MarR family transcriptional regulator [Noviherbaspirillum sp.]|jgi:MarR family transcriptional regulator for hemolysin|uniref:MarR family winged helix-turn-helix transcriptional regulator n=1 Tax=Noviherbaspirillum sp. TaxID=1926288 RepID=UPI002F92CF89
MRTPDRTLMQLTMLLTQASRAYKAAADRLAAGYGLSQAAAWPVIMIGRLGNGVRPGVLADAIGLEPSSLVRLIDQLIASGLVQRTEDETDRRARVLSLTDEGRMRADELEKALLPFRRNLFRGVAASDLDACIRVLDTLCAAVAVHESSQADRSAE